MWVGKLRLTQRIVVLTHWLFIVVDYTDCGTHAGHSARKKSESIVFIHTPF